MVLLVDYLRRLDLLEGDSNLVFLPGPHEEGNCVYADD